ncbi:MAG: ferrous iron transporter B [Candidatus Omnitrophica bacterium]|nr:ferrous iron transporter B [Candidatus Omnitrophota bacterium]
MDEEKRILLMGNPNVGKSAIFSRLTGAKVMISNYPGTTVDFTQGFMKIPGGDPAVIIDVPGVYGLEPLSKADEVAVDMLSRGGIVVNIVDATNLERNLHLTLELRERGIPMVIALNMWDETKHRGIEIDAAKLEKELGVPVIPTSGITGFGIKDLVLAIPSAVGGVPTRLKKEEKWEEVGRIVEVVQKLKHHHHTFLEMLEDVSTHPLMGIPLAGLVLYLSFIFVRGVSEFLINVILAPAFDAIWMPVAERLSRLMGGEGFLHRMIIGDMIDGKIDPGLSFGVLTTGLYVPIVEILPYIFSFYLVLGVMEDSGYLPRLATQTDNLFHRMGLHGYAIVPVILGLGCNVPGALALRLFETRREKFIAATLIGVAVPCMAQTAMIVGLVGQRGGVYLLLIFAVLAAKFVVKGTLMNMAMKGRSPEVLWEIPPYRMPQPGAVMKKLMMRLTSFLTEAVPYVLAGVFLVNILYMSGVMSAASKALAPLISGVWGLPEGTVSAMVVGFLRKDVAVAMLAPLGLSTKQLVIACTVLAVYFPCMATFVMMTRELGIKDMLKSASLMIITAITVGGLLNFFL